MKIIINDLQYQLKNFDIRISRFEERSVDARFQETIHCEFMGIEDITAIFAALLDVFDGNFSIETETRVFNFEGFDLIDTMFSASAIGDMTSSINFSKNIV